MVIRARVSEDRQDDGLTDPGPDRHAVTGDRAKLAKVLVPDVMATHHDRRTAWPDRQSKQSRPPSASPATGQYCRRARASDQSTPSTQSIEIRPRRTHRRVPHRGLPARTATERRRSAPESYFRAPQARCAASCPAHRPPYRPPGSPWRRASPWWPSSPWPPSTRSPSPWGSASSSTRSSSGQCSPPACSPSWAGRAAGPAAGSRPSQRRQSPPSRRSRTEPPVTRCIPRTAHRPPGGAGTRPARAAPVVAGQPRKQTRRYARATRSKAARGDQELPCQGARRLCG